jgi:lysozyme
MMQLGPQGETLIKSFEALRLAAYLDPRGIPTIGWGHTGPEVQMGLTCDPNSAEVWFRTDTGAACRAINATVDVAIAQNQFDALVSFTFNVGVGSEAHSTLLQLLNSGNAAGAADQFLVWNKVNGVENDGLSRRRAAERALFLGLS